MPPTAMRSWSRAKSVFDDGRVLNGKRQENVASTGCRIEAVDVPLRCKDVDRSRNLLKRGQCLEKNDARGLAAMERTEPSNPNMATRRNRPGKTETI